MSYMYAYTRLPRHWLLHLHAGRLVSFMIFLSIFNRMRVYIVAN